MKLETSEGYTITKHAAVCGYSKRIGDYAVAAVVNTLLAEGAQEFGVGVEIRIPVFGYPSRIHGIMKSVKAVCRERDIPLLELEGKKDPALKFAQVTAVGIGTVAKASVNKACGQVRAGQDIVLTKWIGMEGMLRVTEEREEELRKRFSGGFLRQILSYREEVFADREIALVREEGAAFMLQVEEGGILAALWELAKNCGTGLSLDMKAISVLQETVEVCEHFRLNPYQLSSVGSFLVVTDEGDKLCEKLREQGVHASLIGHLTDNNDKVIHNGGEVRYIDRPAPDEIYKIFAE